jgi:predicted RND superfamily exporter protein
MAIAMRRAGPAIIASGLTVIAGMLCLLAASSLPGILQQRPPICDDAML